MTTNHGSLAEAIAQARLLIRAGIASHEHPVSVGWSGEYPEPTWHCVTSGARWPEGFRLSCLLPTKLD